MQGDGLQRRHAVSMTDCTTLSAAGVSEVVSFDEMSVVLVTSCGVLTLEGDGLHIARLDLEKGETDITGHITGMFYAKAREKGGGFFRRGK